MLRRVPAIGLYSATIAGGLACAAWVGARSHGRMDMETWAVAAVVGVMIVITWVRPLILYRPSSSQAFQLDEGFFVVLALVVPPAVTLGVFAAGVTMAQIIRRRSPVKSAFNLGVQALGVSLGLLTSRHIAVPAGRPELAPVMAALVGAAVYFATSTGLTSAVMVAMGSSWRSCLIDDLGPQLGLSATGAIVGTLLAVDLQVDRWTGLLAVPLLMVFRLLLTAQFKAQHDRARMQGLFNVTLDANRRLRQESVLDSVLEAAREQLRCPEARFSTVPPSPGDIASSMEIAGRPHWLVVSGRRREEPFDKADQLLLDAIAAIAKGALTNAELYRQVRYERGRLASITLNIGEGVCAVDVRGNLTFVNPAAAALIRLPTRSMAIGDSMPRDAMRAPEFLLQPARGAMSAGRVVRVEDATFEGRDGAPLSVAYSASAVRQNGEVVGAVIAFRDITERKKLEADMTRQALYDSLTGLANRRLLVERLEAALERSRTDGRVHALIFVDVDRFKAINDSLGHGTGDGLLVAVGNRMKQVVGPKGLLARFGGDEFVILVEEVTGVDEAVAVARRLCTAVEVPLVLPDGYEIVASLSVGIALTEPGQTADDALRDADVAMYRAKGRGGTFQVFDKALMGTRSSERIDLEAALRKGIDRGELEVYYQPLVDVSDQRIVGAEALVRWRHPTDGLVMPDRFIPMAEETGLILPLGTAVLQQACERIAAVRNRLGIDLPISVNLSPRQFQQSGLLSEVAAVLDGAALPSNLLVFEITETMVMDDLAGATEIMKKLNRLGVKLAVDDFGTGHSSLGYLKSFPVHEVKVDRIFVKNLATDRVDSAIVRAVVDLADAVGITAVAEGVETKEQLAALRMLGCHVGQGYLFSRPVPAEEFDALIEAQVSIEPAPEPRNAAARPPLRAV